MDIAVRSWRNFRDGRYHHEVYASTSTRLYLVVFDLQWKIIECQRLERCADLAKSMSLHCNDLPEDGWQPESTARFGFVFLQRQGNRRLLDLSERDPHDSASQTFSPFK